MFSQIIQIRPRQWHTLVMLLSIFVSTMVVVPVEASPSVTAPAHFHCSPLEIVIDTDPGVDDAAAIVWLLSQRPCQVQVLGIGTVVGNTTVENAANNVLTLLDVLGRQDIPVAIGAAEPLSQPNNQVSMLIHGPDGLWGVGMQNPHDLSGLPQDVPAFYRDLAEAHPGATLLALGPLTNLAQAIEQYPEAMQGFGQIIAVGGSRMANTPLLDYNPWQDPEAAHIVLSSGIPVILVLREANEQFILRERDLQALMNGSDAAQLIAGPMQFYAATFTGLGGESDAAFPDVTAAIYAINPRLGTAESALVKMVTEPSLARGQTIIGLNLMERLSMIASPEELSELAVQAMTDPGFDLMLAVFEILSREPDNGQVLLDVRERQMRMTFMRALRH
jgi:inosine-uridine nucleoside N-ribohydrolase